MTAVLPDIDFKTWFEESIPCDQCDEPAELQSRGHLPVDCTGEVHYKCSKCYGQWRIRVQSMIDDYECVGCKDCDGAFYTVEDFSNYREF